MHKLGAGLISFVSTKPAYPLWGLDVIKAVLGSNLAIVSESGGHETDYKLVSDLLVTLLEYVLHAREDSVLAAWQECVSCIFIYFYLFIFVYFHFDKFKMRIGKQLDTEQATQIRLRLLGKLREHVTGQTTLRFHPEIGFTPDLETWNEELVVCQAVVTEIASSFAVGKAFVELVNKEEWIQASVNAARALLTNCIYLISILLHIFNSLVTLKYSN